MQRLTSRRIHTAITTGNLLALCLRRFAHSVGRHRSTLALVALAGFLFHGCLPGVRPENVWKHPSYQGVVLDVRTGSPVAGASVTWEEGKLSTVTDASGRFALPGERGARVGMMCFGDSMENRTLLVSHPQYRDRRLSHRHVMNGDPIEDLGEITIAPRNP